MSALPNTSLDVKARDHFERLPHSNRLLNVATQGLQKLGGYDLIESTTIEGIQNLNPERTARKNIFLKEALNKPAREALKRTLQLWIEALNSSADISTIIETCRVRLDKIEQLLSKNLKTTIAQTRELESSYRSIALFFKNTELGKVTNVSFINADPDQLRDLDNPIFIDAVQAELNKNYDRLDLRDNYGLLVVPGYLGSSKVVEKWAKMAHENKVLLVTDFEHLDSPDDVMELFEGANLTGGDVYRSNLIMTCNWLVGRGKFREIGEQEDLHIPPSAALAGKIYSTLMSQVAAGRKYGVLNEVDGVKFDLKKAEIANLEKLGLVPMVKEYSRVMAFSAKTLFNGDNLGLQTYSVVRVFDYVAKVMMDFLNRCAFQNFTASTRKDLHAQIVRFLDSITGPSNKLIENFSIKRFEQDPLQKDRIYLDIHLKPFFPAKTFLIKLDGQKRDDGTEWAAEYAQEI